jgi:LAS superfamily LD-carboxypeptidase LdcB
MANCSHHKSETTFKIDQSKDTLINNNKADSLGFTIEYVMGKFDPKTHPDFIEIPLNYADQSGRLMRKDAFEAFQRMAEQAAKENIKIIIKSSTRNFDYQKGIWERKWKGETVLEDGTKASDIKDTKERALMILKYSSMPGTSRHHWGTDIDINAFENTYFETGDGLKLYNWMLLHAADFGFCQVYDAKGENRVSGYNEEKWHWSYMPISSIITSIASQKLKNEMIAGFLGSEVATKVDMVNNYVLSISKKCYP